MPLIVVPILLAVGVIVGFLVPRTLLVALMAFTAVAVLAVAGLHFHVIHLHIL